MRLFPKPHHLTRYSRTGCAWNGRRTFSRIQGIAIDRVSMRGGEMRVEDVLFQIPFPKDCLAIAKVLSWRYCLMARDASKIK